MRKVTNPGIPSLKPNGRRLQRDNNSHSPHLGIPSPSEERDATFFAFTLVELIVVIIILAILGTIAFIAMQGYSKDARDSVRISNMSKITTSLELYNIDSGKYPDPTEAYPVTYSGSLVWYQGTFGNSTFMNVEKIDKIPTDPVTEKEYVYSLLGNKQEYQLGGISEGDEYGMNSLHPSLANQPHPNPLLRGEGIKGIGQVNASEKTARALVRGTYNGMALRVNTLTKSYVLAVPSIITSLDLSVEGSDNRKLEYIVEQKEIVLNGYKNLPNNYLNSNYIVNKEVTNEDYKIIKDNNILNSIIYEGDVSNLTSQELVNKLQLAYGGTTLQESGDLNELMNLSTTQLDKQEGADNFGVNFINRYLGGSAVNKIYATCGGIAHNTTMTYYSTGSVDFGQTCESIGIDFTCIDGTWVDQITSLNITNYPETECEVELPLDCEYLGMPLDHGDILTVYSQPTILWNATENCIDEGIEGEVTCNNGVVEGDNTYSSLTCTKGTPSNCEEEVKVIGGHSYDIPALNHAGTGSYIDEITENNGIFRYTYNAICNDGTITGNETGPENVSCNTNYTWNGTTEICEANTQIFTCGTKPLNTIWNTVGSYEQTWSGTEWLPVNSTPTYNLTSSNNECRYKCETGYYWNSSSCVEQWSGDATNGYIFKNTSGDIQYPSSCSDLIAQSLWKTISSGSPWNGTKFVDGYYWIKPNTDPAFKVYCDMTSQGGGWTRYVNIKGNYANTDALECFKGTMINNSTLDCFNPNRLGILANEFKVRILGNDYDTEIAYNNSYSTNTILNQRPCTGHSDYFTVMGASGATYPGPEPESVNYVRMGRNFCKYNRQVGGKQGASTYMNYARYGYGGPIQGTREENAVNSELFIRDTNSYKSLVINDGGYMFNSGTYAYSCKDYLNSSYYNGEGSGIYWLKTNSDPAFKVYCDMTTDGGGWTLIYSAVNNTNPMTESSFVGLRSNSYLTLSKIQTLANLSTNVYIKDDVGGYVTTVDNKPILRLRAGLTINGGYGLGVDTTTSWTGNHVSDLTWKWIEDEDTCYSRVTAATLPMFYWACGTTGAHITNQDIQKGWNFSTYSNIDIMIR